MTTHRIPPTIVLEVLARDGGCIAPRLGGSYHDCGGRDRLEHVKKEPRMGVRAEPLANRLLVLCEGHTEPGMKAGYVWATDKANREKCRAYLRVWAAFATVLKRDQWWAYLNTPAPIFHGDTALSLIVNGRDEDVLASLEQLASGAFV